jgi:ribosomal-protein-alanine N-acetyltransferase
VEPVLETPRLVLRKLDHGDVGAMFAILSDPVTMRFWPAPFDRAAAERWVRRSIDSYASRGFGRYAVIEKKSGALLGDCGFLRLEVDGEEENDLGYILAHRFWGNGFATEAAGACLVYGFESLGFQRVVASMEEKHLASRRVAEKIGFRLERSFRNARNRNLPTILLSRERR